MSTQEKPKAGRIPWTLFECYQNYKKATASIVSWILQNSNPQRSQSNGVSINELKHLVQGIKKQQIEAPVHIRQAFEIAIAGRKQVTQSYAREEVSRTPETLSHLHFTEK